MVYSIPLANTKAKLPRSISIKVGPDFDPTQTTIDASALSKYQTIGAIEKISIDQTVELHEWREFDSGSVSLGGGVVEWAPGKETIKLTLDGVILYNPGDIVDSVNAAGEKINIVDSLLSMRKSFLIEILEKRPVGTTIQTRSTAFVGCRFEDRPMTIDIGTSDLIKQSCKVSAAALVRTQWA